MRIARIFFMAGFGASVAFACTTIQAQVTEQKMGGYTAKWLWINGSDGSKSAIDLTSITAMYGVNGAVDAVVYFHRGGVPWMSDARRFRFDCQGKFMDIDAAKALLPIRAGSVVGEMASIACTKSRGPNS